MNAHFREKVAIAGVGQAGLGNAKGFTELEILAQAAHAAVADAGLRMSDIDGLATASVLAPMWAMPVIEYLGIKPSFIDSTMLGGSSFVAHLMPAIHALNSGECNAVLVCYGSTQRSSAISRKVIAGVRRDFDPQPYEYPYEPLNPLSTYAMAAARHMHDYGTTRENLADVVVAARAWAMLNPEAQRRDPLTREEVLSAKMISDPLSALDCCMVNDGAAAYVLIRADRAKDLPHPPVHVLGNATRVFARQGSSLPRLTETAAVETGREAFRMAGVAPADIDVAEVYDAFSINTILFLEDLGFCPKGEGGGFVADGGIAPGGRLPVNTNGGGLSCIHPGMYGAFIMIEAVRQLRGTCGERQVARAELALVHGNGGTLSSQSTAILGTSATV
ncbi:thiolase (plasmid) [Antarctobacter heliothermus]|uniref:Thiolase n=1 Tax=Antarctobacter heliothermus TaxID=74033 RepID=A0A222EBE1_9RHOB|nr:acetyl-CoA acetyltransferase [Antarctobacter heliothermus]ASP23505.1 thiolase [Antarctobacter heliothermus]